jgi:MoaA/NifB/PqqE/SkfB family radical SAM enzyme
MDRVDLMLNRKCNTNCIFCYLHGVPDHCSDFSLSRIRSVLDKGAEMGLREVYLSGGEPTLREDLAEIISYARRGGYDHIKMMTNGLRLSYPAYLRRLADAGLDEIAFSLHGGDARTHDIHTCYRGSFGLITTAISNALEAGMRVEINSVITRFNIGRMDAILDYAISKGIHHVHLQLVVPNSPGNKKIYPDVADITKYFSALSKYSGRISHLTFAFIPFCYLRGMEGTIGRFDFTQPFFSNATQLFEDWAASLLDAKVVRDGCRKCPDFSVCRGHWDA